jgi:signal-transduction protein with cAMP-binding, CBS, and nucleotidyltransferase domain
MHIGDICTRSVVTCAPQISVLALAQLMRDQHVTDVIVVEERESRRMPVGIVTFRDMVVRVVANRAEPESTAASEVMSRSVETALESEFIYDAIWHMRSKRVRKLAVVDAHNALVGVLTVDDVTQFLAGELIEVARISPVRPAAGQALSEAARR